MQLGRGRRQIGHLSFAKRAAIRAELQPRIYTTAMIQVGTVEHSNLLSFNKVLQTHGTHRLLLPLCHGMRRQHRLCIGIGISEFLLYSESGAFWIMV